MKAAELLNKMKSGSPILPGRFRGWAKESTAPDRISFSPLGDCHGWVDLPLSVVGDVEVVGSARCEDHSHAEVIITLDGEDPLTVAVGQLLSLLRDTVASVRKYAGASPDMPLDCWKKWADCKIFGGDKCDTYDLLCGGKRMPDDCIKKCQDLTGESAEVCRHLCKGPRPQ